MSFDSDNDFAYDQGYKSGYKVGEQERDRLKADLQREFEKLESLRKTLADKERLLGIAAKDQRNLELLEGICKEFEAGPPIAIAFREAMADLLTRYDAEKEIRKRDSRDYPNLTNAVPLVYHDRRYLLELVGRMRGLLSDIREVIHKSLCNNHYCHGCCGLCSSAAALLREMEEL